MSSTLVSLHLRQGEQTAGKSGEADALRRMLGDALTALTEVLVAGEAGTSADVISLADGYRTEVAAGAAVDKLEPLATACFKSARAAAARVKNRTAEQRVQVAAVIAMVQETVKAMAGENASVDVTLSGSADRFERLARVDDLQRIQAQLVSEVATLKRVTLERRQAWEQTSLEFGSRLSTLEKQLDHTRREASLDSLTGIANRRTFERTCREWLEPNRPGFVLAMIDVDNFKQVNDQCGHAVGDQLLVSVAETLSASLRAGSLVARVGGDEFALLVADITLRQAEARFAAVGRAVQAACRLVVQDGDAPSITIGVAECSAGDTLQSLQQRADAALYEAKRSGKGRVATKASPLMRDLLRGTAHH
jgi:diguanylate cyclase (GGDEF)-like protein